MLCKNVPFEWIANWMFTLVLCVWPIFEFSSQSVHRWTKKTTTAKKQKPDCLQQHNATSLLLTSHYRLHFFRCRSLACVRVWPHEPLNTFHLDEDWRPVAVLCACVHCRRFPAPWFLESAFAIFPAMVMKGDFMKERGRCSGLSTTLPARKENEQDALECGEHQLCVCPWAYKHDRDHHHHLPTWTSMKGNDNEEQNCEQSRRSHTFQWRCWHKTNPQSHPKQSRRWEERAVGKKICQKSLTRTKLPNPEDEKKVRFLDRKIFRPHLSSSWYRIVSFEQREHPQKEKGDGLRMLLLAWTVSVIKFFHNRTVVLIKCRFECQSLQCSFFSFLLN